MVGNLITRLIRAFVKPKTTVSIKNCESQALAEANALVERGSIREALPIFQRAVEVDPHDAQAHNGLGICYSEIGDSVRAKYHFEIAHTLDDLDPAILANWAKIQLDSHQYQEAWNTLQSLAALNSDFPHLYAVYSGLCIAMGEAEKARVSSLKAWLGNFQSLRSANIFLFNNAYACQSEKILTAEHRFWAETLIRPQAVCSPGHNLNAPDREALETRRIRIAYWSPDFRNHSVRYFFKPLLTAHDRSRFEIHLLHDINTRDEQTDFFQNHCDSFHDVHGLTDGELREFIRTQQFDILVELAGHTSANRLNLLSEKLARVQMTALGYPPTTGLRSIDFKLADRFISTPEAQRYYSERLLALPTSFWCFDPMESAPLADEPPVMRNGYITFGCVGNLSKISDELLQAWHNVLNHVTNSRLLIRAIPLVSDFIKEHWRKKLELAGLPVSRVDLMPPLGGEDFFKSYNEIDIVLDTFPFNGGTTTSFAVYMGVPVVSISGESLVSRMGLSILGNVGLPSLVAVDVKDYVQNAVELARNIERLRTLKKTLRETMLGNALGNGKAFASEFEEACLYALSSVGEQGDVASSCDETFALPQKELTSRAFKVLAAGNSEGARRIIEYAVRRYGESAGSLIARSLTSPDDVHLDVRETVEKHLSELNASDQGALLLYFARRTIITSRQVDLAWALERLADLPISDPSDLQMLRLLRAYVFCRSSELPKPNFVPSPVNATLRPRCPEGVSLLVVMATTEPLDVGEIRERVVCSDLCEDTLQVHVVSVTPEERWSCISRLATQHNYVMLVNENTKILQDLDVSGPLELLEQHSIVGVAGCRRWTRMSWTHDEATHCEGTLIVPSEEAPGFFDLVNLGEAYVSHAAGMAVLDGSLLLFRSRLLQGVDPPEYAEAGMLADTLWSAACAEQGHSLVVCNELNVALAPPSVPANRLSLQLLVEGIRQRYGFDLLEEGLIDKRHLPSLPCESLGLVFAIRKYMLHSH